MSSRTPAGGSGRPHSGWYSQWRLEGPLVDPNQDVAISDSSHPAEEDLRQQVQLLGGEIAMLKAREQETRTTVDKERKDLVDVIHQQRDKIMSRDLEIEKLQQMIQVDSDGEDQMDAKGIKAEFHQLENHIFALVGTHFASHGEHSSWVNYESIEKVEDRDYFLRAWIANELHQKLFSKNPRLFGLAPEVDVALSAFEDQIWENRAAPGDIANWRMHTIRLAKFIRADEGEARISELCNHLCKSLTTTKPCYEPAMQVEVRDAVYQLCRRAFKLATICREASHVYVWEQDMPSDRLDPVIAQRIPKFNVGSANPSTCAPRIMFGPVSTQDTLSDFTVLRTGIILDI